MTLTGEKHEIDFFELLFPATLYVWTATETNHYDSQCQLKSGKVDKLWAGKPTSAIENKCCSWCVLSAVTSVNHADIELDTVLPRPVNTPEELEILCGKIEDDTFKKQLVCHFLEENLVFCLELLML